MMPAMTCRSVLLPAPLGPMTASDSPCTTRNETSRSAQKDDSPLRGRSRFVKLVLIFVLRVKRRL